MISGGRKNPRWGRIEENKKEENNSAAKASTQMQEEVYAVTLFDPAKFRLGGFFRFCWRSLILFIL